MELSAIQTRCFHSPGGRTAENAVGTQPTDVQRLKAEIAALAVELDDGTRFEGEHVDVINRAIHKLRQLSAV